MSNKEGAKFSLKLVMNKQNTKVLFAEADSDFANVLLSFLTLPLGKIVRLLQKQYGAADDEAPAIGSLTTLYNGLANLDVANFQEEGVKKMLLDPRRSCTTTKFFCCQDLDCYCSKKDNMSMYHGIARCNCGKLLIREVRYSTSRDDQSESDDDDDVAAGGAFAASGASFIVSDDLLILPNAAGSVIHILVNLGITDSDTEFGEMRNVTFGNKEIMDLLKGLFCSQTPLTDVVLNDGRNNFATPPHSGPKVLLPKVEKKASSSSSSTSTDKMTLKVTVQTSSNKILFAQAEEEFIDLLFSLLTIPLGGVECLLDGNTCLKTTDNLYKSVVEHIGEKYFESAVAINSLSSPTVPHGYMVANNNILPVEEEKACKIYYYRGSGTGDDFASAFHNEGGSCVKVTSFKYTKGYTYLRGLRLYMVNDDLTVEPSGMTSYFSKLRSLKIPLSDITELELGIGVDEVLSILKAAFVSKSALTCGLSPFCIRNQGTFRRADNHFVNVLLSFLTLPLGKIVSLLQKQQYDEAHAVVGSLTTLYNSLANSGAADFCEEGVKQMLLHPRRACLHPTDFFRCEDIACYKPKINNICMYYGIARCECGFPLTRQIRSNLTSVSDDDDDDDDDYCDDDYCDYDYDDDDDYCDYDNNDDDDDIGGCFAAVSGVTFIVSDDLRIWPNAVGSVIQILGIADKDFGEMKTVTFGYKEIMALLKGSFLSQTPLTDIVLNNGEMNLATPKISLPMAVGKGSSSDSKKVALKVTVQTSTNKILLAQAEEDSVLLLFSLLTIPLGGIERVLDGKTSLTNIDNLYNSVAEHIGAKYFKTGSVDTLVAPKLPHGFTSVNQYIPLEEETACEIYYYATNDYVSLYRDPSGSGVKVPAFKFPNSYMKGPRLYTVNDDLSVAPSSMTSCLSYLRGLNIPVSDLTELELHIGSEEVLSILNAALVSKSALSCGLGPFLMKRQNQEH